MTSLAHEELEAGLSALHDVLEDLLATRGRGGSGGWERRVREGLHHLSQARERIEGQDAEAVSAIDRVAEELLAAQEDVRAAGSSAAGEEGPLPTLEEGRSFVRDLRKMALDWVERLPARVESRDTEAGATELRGSRGVPRAHRGLAIPSPDVAAVEPTTDTATEVRGALARLDLSPAAIQQFVDGDGGDEDADEDDDDARGLALPSMDRGSPLELLHLRAAARACLEDIALLGNLRRSQPEDPWLDAESFETRLLANLDALVALELPRLDEGARIGVSEALWSYAIQWAVPDLGRSFAFAFCLACTTEVRAIRWALVGLRRASPRVHASYVDALALGSNPHLDGELLSALRSEGRPSVVLTLLRAMERRGLFDAASMLPLLAHPDTRIVRAAVACSLGGPAELVVPALALLLEGDPVVAVDAALVMSIFGEQAGPKALRDFTMRVSEAPGALPEEVALAAGQALAVLGDLRDGPLLRQLAARLPELLPSLGSHGDPASALVLCDALGTLPETLERDIARALDRLLGAHPEGWRRTIASGTSRVEAWREVLGAAKLDQRTRVRRGQPMASGREAVRGLARELLDPETLHNERLTLVQELRLARRGPCGVDPVGWCATQKARLLTLTRDPAG